MKKTLVSCVLLVWLVPFCKQTIAQSNVDALISETTEMLQIELKLQSRGMSTPASVANAYTNRGKLFLLAAEKPAEAERDFRSAVKMLKSAPRPNENIAFQDWMQSAGDTLLFLAQAEHKQGRPINAFATATQAIKAYRQLVAEGRESGEPLVAYAVKTKFTIIQDLQSLEESEKVRALEEADVAIAFLQKWAQKKDGDFFASECVTLRKDRASFAKPSREVAPKAAASALVLNPSTPMSVATAPANQELDYSNRPYGVWLSDTIYVNHYFPSMQVSLSGNWVRGNPTAEPLKVIQMDGKLIPEGATEIKREQVNKAIVLFAKADYGGETNTLEVRYRGIHKSSPDMAIELAIAELRQDMTRVSPVIVKTIETRTQICIEGVTYEVVDTDRFYKDFTLHHRIYFCNVEDQIVSFSGSFERPELRTGMDRLLADTIEWLPQKKAVSAQEKTARESKQIFDALKITQPEMRKRQAEIDDLVKARAFNVRQIRSTLSQPVLGSFFPDDAYRVARTTTADEYYNSAVQISKMSAEKSSELTKQLLRE